MSLFLVRKLLNIFIDIVHSYCAILSRVKDKEFVEQCTDASGLPYDKIVLQPWYPIELTSKWGQDNIYHRTPGCTPYGTDIVY